MDTIPRAATLYSAGSAGIRTMKQSFASAAGLPRRRAHSQDGVEARGEVGSPPPRIVVGSPVAKARRGPELLCFRSF
jgi:hypothetical protein